MDKQNEKDNTLEFISMYRNLECLWRVQCEDYSNKNKRNSALDALLDIYRKVVPGAKKADVLRKINTLRSSFRRELKKINESKKSGSGTDELYTPSLYYFDELSFVVDQDVSHCNSFIKFVCECSFRAIHALTHLLFRWREDFFFSPKIIAKPSAIASSRERGIVPQPPLDLELNDDRCDSSERASCIYFMQLFHADCYAA